MSQRPTPETDAATVTTDYLTGEQVIPAHFARRLERERDEARELLASEKSTRNAIMSALMRLYRDYPMTSAFFATARQRCEAFLRVHGQWEEEA